MRKKERRALIINGVRTPFVKAFGSLMKVGTIELGAAAVSGLFKKTDVPPGEIDAIVWGGVILPSLYPNVGREIALELGLPPHIHGMTVSRACASGLQAITSAASMIERGEADVVIAGGSDSTSNMEFSLPQKAIHALAPLMFGKFQPKPKELLQVLSQLTPINEILPKKPRIAERSTGQLMGEAAESMAERNQISREAQDTFALRSHLKAYEAQQSGRLAEEITPVEAEPGKWITKDDMIRGGTTLEKLAKLRPVFSSNGGTITAGTASPLTDGASCVLMMSEEKAAALGFTGKAAIASSSYVGVDPFDQLLIGPALAMPEALNRAGKKLHHMDFVDIHEAFAAQVLSVTKAMASPAFSKERLGRSDAFGEIDDDKLNPLGGSIAIGHPFGATGARIVTTMANELATHDKEHALIGICAAGGLAGAAVLERVS